VILRSDGTQTASGPGAYWFTNFFVNEKAKL